MKLLEYILCSSSCIKLMDMIPYLAVFKLFLYILNYVFVWHAYYK